MHIEIQVALNFVISYLYNKLPRRRVNIFGEELEKALKDKFQGHWYPEKPFKGSAFRCLKTGDPIDSVLERAARESGVPIADILENLPNELSVWVDPGEVSYRVGEKGAVKILYSENSDNHEDNTSADREVNKTFNPEAQCFRPIDAVNTSMNSLNLSPKTSPQSGSSPHSASSTSPTYKGSPNPAAGGTTGGGAAAGSSGNGNGSGSGNGSAASFMQRAQAPLTFTTATFAQTKFGSTKLKTSSKRANSSSYRMSPTEFSNYIKQRAMQQQLHHGHGHAAPQPNHFGPIGPVSPARSLSPNPLALGLGQNADPFYFPNMANMYPQFNGHRNIFDAHFHPEANGLYAAANGGAGGGAGGAGGSGGGGGGSTAGHQSKFNAYLEPHGFYGIGNHMQQQQHMAGPPPPQQQQQHQQQQHQQQQQQQHQHGNAKNGANADAAINNKDGGGHISTNKSGATAAALTVAVPNGAGNAEAPPAVSPVSPAATVASSANAAAAAAAAAAAVAANNQDSNNSKLIDGLNSFYSNATGSYQQLLVAN